MVSRGRAKVYLWTGNGAGKTTSALGVALRAIGHGKKVIIIQFMKGRQDAIGEYKIRHLLEPWYEIHQFGTRRFVNLKNPSKNDKDLAQEALAFARVAAKRKPFLLFLDEINLAVACGLVPLSDVLILLNEVPAKTNVYMTGRHAPKKLIQRADYATLVSPIKGPQLPKRAKKGIDY